MRVWPRRLSDADTLLTTPLTTPAGEAHHVTSVLLPHAEDGRGVAREDIPYHIDFISLKIIWKII